jgi:hypothetical protein
MVHGPLQGTPLDSAPLDSAPLDSAGPQEQQEVPRQEALQVPHTEGEEVEDVQPAPPLPLPLTQAGSDAGKALIGR